MITKDNQYQHSDENGSYTVCFGDSTIEVKFVGLLSEKLLGKFCDDLGMMLRVIEWKFWGYYGDLSDCDDKSAQTHDILVKLRKRFSDHGCIVEAYTVTNPMTIENIIKLRMASGAVHTPIEDNLFPNRHQALKFIQKVLLKITNKQNNPNDKN